MTTTTFFNDQSYTLSSLSIVPSIGGQNIDVTPMLIELNIYEDIYSAYMSGNMVINDSLDLVSNLPLIGFEYLYMSFSKPGSKSTVTKTFRIYKVDNMVLDHVSQSNQNYIIRFCSEENIISLSTKMSKSYKGMLISDMIKDIMNNILKTPSNKISKIEGSTGQFDYIIPNLYPFEAINWLTSKSLPIAFFFENSLGYNYVSLKTLFASSPLYNYYFAPQNIDNSRTKDNQYGIRNIMKVEYLKNFNIAEGIMNGTFASVTKTFDPIRQLYSEINFDYLNYFQNSPHIEKNPNPFITNFKDRTGNTVNQNAAAMQKHVVTNLGHDKVPTIALKQPGLKPSLIEQWLPQRMSVINQLNYLKLKIVVPGDPTVPVGSIINANIPSPVSKQQNNKYSLNHPYYSGNFLVTAIRHKIDLQSYTMIMEITKDSLPIAYPQSKDSDPILKAAKTS